MSSLSQHVDEHYGHVTVGGDTWASMVATLIDMGDTVMMDHQFIGPWSEAEAREVGAALIGWAARKRLARGREGT